MWISRGGKTPERASASDTRVPWRTSSRACCRRSDHGPVGDGVAPDFERRQNRHAPRQHRAQRPHQPRHRHLVPDRAQQGHPQDEQVHRLPPRWGCVRTGARPRLPTSSTVPTIHHVLPTTADTAISACVISGRDCSISRKHLLQFRQQESHHERDGPDRDQDQHGGYISAETTCERRRCVFSRNSASRSRMASR